jgi:hypothetical protein
MTKVCLTHTRAHTSPNAKLHLHNTTSRTTLNNGREISILNQKEFQKLGAAQVHKTESYRYS